MSCFVVFQEGKVSRELFWAFLISSTAVLLHLAWSHWARRP